MSRAPGAVREAQSSADLVHGGNRIAWLSDLCHAASPFRQPGRRAGKAAEDSRGAGEDLDVDPLGLADAADAVAAVYGSVTTAVTRLGEADLMRASRCAGWAVADTEAWPCAAVRCSAATSLPFVPLLRYERVMDAVVSALSDCPEFVPVVARWHWPEWGRGSGWDPRRVDSGPGPAGWREPVGNSDVFHPVPPIRAVTGIMPQP
jgi:hypothetical protein